MNTFHTLWREGVGPEIPPSSPDRRGELFADRAARSPVLHPWVPGGPIPPEGRRLLIGVAHWSGYDMELLDLLEEPPSPQRFTGVLSGTGVRGGMMGLPTVPIPTRPQVDVFDVAQCRSEADFDLFIPGTGRVLQTPVVGLWVDGHLVEKASGFTGRLLVMRECGLDPRRVNDRLATVNQR
jgi:hypothetical protein